MKLKTITKGLFVIWFVAILVVLGIFLSASNQTTLNSQQSTVLVIAILVGLFAFLGAIFLSLVSFLVSRKGTPLKPSGKAKRAYLPLVGVLLFLLLSIGALSVRGAYLLGQQNQKNITQYQPTTGYTLSATDYVKSSPTPTPTPTTNPDPLTTCTSTYPNCSGQSIQARQSQCSKITCCQVGDTWSVYLSEDECKKKQEEELATAYPPCYVYGQTFNVKPETCSYYQAQEQALNKPYNPVPVQPSTPSETTATDYSAQNQRNIEMRSQCQSSVATYYQQIQADIRSRKDLGDSSKQKLLQSNQGQWKAASAECEAMYPVY